LPATKTTLSVSKTKGRPVPVKSVVSKPDSKEIDESGLQYQKHDGKRISLLQGIATLSAHSQYRIIFDPEGIVIYHEFPATIEMEYFEISENAEPSRKPTSRAITINQRTVKKNTTDSICGNCEFLPNETNESDLQHEKHNE
jgi:hypothetical protein